MPVSCCEGLIQRWISRLPSQTPGQQRLPQASSAATAIPAAGQIGKAYPEVWGSWRAAKLARTYRPAMARCFQASSSRLMGAGLLSTSMDSLLSVACG
ncbi:hypothetical protein D3C78_1446260 [compost metagenome]